MIFDGYVQFCSGAQKRDHHLMASRLFIAASTRSCAFAVPSKKIAAQCPRDASSLRGHSGFISSVANGNSRGPEALAELVAELGPRARAATAEDAAKTGEIVVVSIPRKNDREVPVAPLAGKVVIDTNNYYPQRDGHTAELDNESTTTAELLQAHLPTSKVVKAFISMLRS